MKIKVLQCILLLFLVHGIGATNISESPLLSADADSITLVDPKASRQTKALYRNLKMIAGQHIMFGHQDDLAYGVMWKGGKQQRSDIHDVSGRFPAVFGWDLSKLGSRPFNIDTVEFRAMRSWMIRAYKMGGINTVSWHVDNFVTGGDSWDSGTANVVASILPGGEHHQLYKDKLDLLAGYFKSLKTGTLIKRSIPIIFRPFHEHTGPWFWWGQPHCSPEEYKSLWRFTVHYLRDVKKVHNLLYCYSPDIFEDEAHYLECYPGNEYVDIMGLDNYHDVHPDNDPSFLTKRLNTLVQIAEKHNKVAALTETGLEGITETNWWTDLLLHAIKSDQAASRIAWVLVWRNANTTHHYGPYPEHHSAENFRTFCQDPLILMADNLPLMYRMRTRKNNSSTR